jgi:malonyl-CoA O-methyltransferase
MKIGEIVQTEVKQISKVVQEFSRFAHKYDTYNMIQSTVATTLIEKLPKIMYKNIIDVGCGSGEIYKNLQKKEILVESFIALDSSQAMLAIHPNEKHIDKICLNFNDRDFLEYIPRDSYDLLLSSSALQWSTDLGYTMQKLSLLSSTFYGAVFTSGTFKTLHETAGVSSPIHNVGTVQDVMNQYYNDVKYEIHHYSLEFESTRDMFRYIKQSGVSSGERKLTYKQTKKLMERYPLNYLEFEVLFIEARK